MSNPFSALDFSDDENITVVKPAEGAKPEKKQHIAPNRDSKPHLPRKEMEAQEEAIKDLSKKKTHPQGQRGNQPQPEVTHPGEKAKLGLKKEQRPDTHKQPADSERRGRQFERHSGTGRGREIKKGGGGGRNWGKPGDEQAPLPTTTPDVAEGAEAAPSGEAAEQPPVVEEDPSITLEEYERLKASKRVGEAFQEKEARKVTASIEGKVYKKDEQDGEGVYIKLGEDEPDLKKKPGHLKNKQKQVFEVDFKVRDTSAEAPPRRGRPEGSRGEGRAEGSRGGEGRGEFRGEGRGEFRGEGRGEGRGPRPPREEGGNPRPPREEGFNPRPRGGGAPRGGAPGGRGRGAPAGPTGRAPAGASAGRIDTADQSAFPKLGGSA